MRGDALQRGTAMVKPWSSLEGASVSFDHFDPRSDRVVFTYTLRDAQHSILETFHTELHTPVQPRPLTPAETAALLAFGVFHSTYVYLPFATEVKLLQVRAGRLSPPQLSFFQTALEGALAEYFYLADTDLNSAFEIQCCCADQLLASTSEPSQSADEINELAHAEGGPASSTELAHAEGGAASSTPTPTPTPAGAQEHLPRVLVPFGGGKDSTLLIEMLHGCGCEVQWAYYGEWLGSWGDYPKFSRLVEASLSKSVLVAEQHLPCIERLRELNLRPDINFTDYVAYVSYYVFSSVFLALQRGFTAVCVGNEYSANAINLVHPRYGYEINHQYEKSFRAERAFSAYIRSYISPAVLYFSGLQHMSELEIAKLFAARCGRYLPLIISCNWATDDDWCGGCEKCAFVYAIFSAYLPTETVMGIFERTAGTASTAAAGPEAGVLALPPAGSGSSAAPEAAPGGGAGCATSPPSPPCSAGQQPSAEAGPDLHPNPEPSPGSSAALPLVPDASTAPSMPSAPPATLDPSVTDMFDSPSHLPVFESLMGLSGHKPLECVGTADEVLAALYLARRRNYQDGARALPLLLRRHGAAVEEAGGRAWLRLDEEMRRAQAGEVRVPTLYPAWYKWAAGASTSS